MWCLRFFLVLPVLAWPTAPPVFQILLAAALLLSHKPCIYCSLLIIGLCQHMPPHDRCAQMTLTKACRRGYLPARLTWHHDWPALLALIQPWPALRAFRQFTTDGHDWVRGWHEHWQQQQATTQVSTFCTRIIRHGSEGSACRTGQPGATEHRGENGKKRCQRC